MDMPIGRRTKQVLMVTKVVNEEKGEVHAIMSTERKDRDGDIIRQARWDLQNFNEHPVLVDSHNYRDSLAQIGEWRDVSVVKGRKQLEGIAVYYKDQGNPKADWAFNIAKMGRAAFSVGFNPDWEKATILDDQGFWCTFEFNGQELLETSQVVVPSNPGALQRMKSLGLHPVIDQAIEDILKMPADFFDAEETVAAISEKDLERIVERVLGQLTVPAIRQRVLDLTTITASSGDVELLAEPDPEPIEESASAMLERLVLESLAEIAGGK